MAMKSSLLLDGSNCPLLVEPSSPDEGNADALVAWAEREGDWTRDKLLVHGAVLFRGFDVQGHDEFERVCRAGGTELRRYVGGDSPRKPAGGDVYTSTTHLRAVPPPRP